MRQSYWIHSLAFGILLLAGLTLSGCAAPEARLDRGVFEGELAALSVLDGPVVRATPRDASSQNQLPQNQPSQNQASQNQAAAGGGAKPVPQEKPATDADRPEDHEDNLWTRREEAAEIAIIQDQLRRNPNWTERPPARRTAATLFGQFSFVDGSSALDSNSKDDPDWNDLLDSGYAIGLEMSYDLVPAVQPLVGVKVNRLQGDGHHFGGKNGDPLIRRETEELQTVPIYAGLRLNFPLDADPGDWFDPEMAGRVVGVIPFLRAVGGVAWVCGQELTLVDKTNNITTRTDFLRRGWTGYFEAAVGIEYRVREGFAFELTVGFEHYLDMKLDRTFENLAPAADSESMTIFFLPRLGASFYF